MRLVFRYLALLFLAQLSFFLTSCNRSSEVGLNPGDLAPEFSLNTLESAARSLEVYRGKVVLLNFWASWCKPCVAELPSLEALYSQLKNEGFVVLAVGVDDEPEALKDFQRQYGLSFPILVDSSGEVKARYKVSGVPESFVIDRAGKLVLFPDPESNFPTVRITGPRDWNSPNVIARLRKIPRG